MFPQSSLFVEATKKKEKDLRKKTYNQKNIFHSGKLA